MAALKYGSYSIPVGICDLGTLRSTSNTAVQPASCLRLFLTHPAHAAFGHIQTLAEEVKKVCRALARAYSRSVLAQQELPELSWKALQACWFVALPNRCSFPSTPHLKGLESVEGVEATIYQVRITGRIA